MRRLVLALALAAPAALVACKADPPSPEDVADRGWRAHELVVAAGERAKTCAAAGAAMQSVFVANRQAFVNAIALDSDRARLAAATAWLEQHEARYADLETRMEALADRCSDDATVQAAFHQMESP